MPDYARQYSLDGTACEKDSVDPVLWDDDQWLHIVVTVPAPDVAPNDAVVGVDLGLAQPAVTSSRQFLCERRWKTIEG